MFFRRRESVKETDNFHGKHHSSKKISLWPRLFCYSCLLLQSNSNRHGITESIWGWLRGDKDVYNIIDYLNINRHVTVLLFWLGSEVSIEKRTRLKTKRRTERSGRGTLEGLCGLLPLQIPCVGWKNHCIIYLWCAKHIFFLSLSL